jgi:3-deoxy-manno-octulosonate cytidylyltransferase (CMP-KDO synthetase)
MSDPRVSVVIPARYASTRFPGKVLAPLAGRPLIVHVIERARAARLPSTVIVATDDARIAEVAARAGAEIKLTSPAHPSGTDRVAEAARDLEAEIVVNLQGDEPCVPPSAVDRCAEPLLEDNAVDMVTLAHIVDRAVACDPNAVKVVCDQRSNALYFSRHPIPFVRDREDAGAPPSYLRHIGIYAFRRRVLIKLAALAPTPLERAESLEQLRALEHGFTIRVRLVDWAALGVDTPDDLRRAEAYLESQEARGPMRRPAGTREGEWPSTSS